MISQPPCRALLRALALVLLPLPLAPRAATQELPAAPPTQARERCATLPATQQALPLGPASEHPFDTARIQAALDQCPAGKAVELVRGGSAGEQDAFLIAPIHLAAGQTLLVDAGVVVFASRNPADYFPDSVGSSAGATRMPLPLISILPGDASTPALLAGHGVIEGRGGAALLEKSGVGHRTWYDLDVTERPPLIEAKSALAIEDLTLRNAPGTVLRVNAAASLGASNAKLAGNALAAGSRGLEVSDQARSVTLADSTIATQGEALVTGGMHAWRIANTSLYAGESAAGTRCVLATQDGTLRCTPAVLALYQGELIADTSSTGAGAAGSMHLTAVVTAPDSSVPVATGEVRFFADGVLLGSRPLHGTSQAVAEFAAPASLTGAHVYTAEYPAQGLVFGLSEQRNEDEAGAKPKNTSPSAIIVLSAPATLPFGNTFTLTASISPATATGSVNFFDAAGTSLGSAAVVQGTALGTASISLGRRPVGSNVFVAQYTGDQATAAASASATVQVTPVPPMMTFTPLSAAEAEAPLTFKVDMLAGATLTAPVTPAYLSQAFNEKTAFLGDSEFNYWPLPIHNFGVAGEPSAAILRRVRNVLQQGFERVVILAGTNDVLHNAVDPPTTVANIKAMTDLLLANGVRPILCTLPPIYVADGRTVDLNPQVIATNALIRAFARENGFVLVDFYNALYPNAQLSYDGVHQYPEGYKVMESALALTLILPTGTVTFPDGSSANLSGTGVTSWTAAPLPAGTQTLTAQYAGDANLLPNTASASVTMPSLASATTLAVSNQPGTVGSTAALMARVTSTGSIPPSGDVNFYDGTSLVGSLTVRPDGTATVTSPTLTDGTHSFSAVYGGDQYLAKSSSASVPLAVQFRATSTSVTSTATSLSARTSIMLTAKVAGADAAGGTVTFADLSAGGSQTIATARLAGGMAGPVSYTPAAGTHSLVATYSGDTTAAPSQSAPLAVQVLQNSTALALQPLAAVAYGTAIRASVTIIPATSTGTVSLREMLPGGTYTLVGQAELAQGAVSFALPSLSIGHHTLVAVFSGSSNDLPSTSAPLDVEIDALASTTALESPVASALWGTAVTLTASVTPVDATGSVLFTDASSGISASVPVRAGKAVWTSQSGSAALAPGVHAFTAAYSGDSLHAPSASGAGSVQVLRAPSTAVLAAVPSTIRLGSSQVLNVALTPATATGVLTLRDLNSGVLGQVTLASGSASLTVTTFGVGAHRIVADYAGDTYFNPSTSSAVDFQVLPHQTSTTLSVPMTKSFFSAPPAVTVSIAPASATGLVAVRDSASGAVVSGTLTNGTATLQLPSLEVGRHSLSATFAGDANDEASSSAAADLTVEADNTSTSLSLAQTSIPAGAPAIFNVRVSTSVASVPSGSVSVHALHAGQQVTLGAVVLGNGLQGQAFGTLSVDSQTLGLGDFTQVTAVYAGDREHAPSGSAGNPVAFSVVRTPVAALLTLSSTQVPVNSPVAVKAVVQAAAGIATGTVTFLRNGTAFASATLDAQGSASTMVPSNSVGTYTISTSYTPSGLFAAAASMSQALAITPPVSIALASSLLKVASPGTAATQVVVTPLSGYAGMVSASCASPVYYITCTVESSAMVNGTPVQLAVHATVAGHAQAGLAAPRLRPEPGDSSGCSGTPLVAITLLPLGALLTRRRRSRVQLAAKLAAALALCAVMGLAGCATGGNFGSIPPGSYALQVHVAASGIDTSVPLTVEVAP